MPARRATVAQLGNHQSPPRDAATKLPLADSYTMKSSRSSSFIVGAARFLGGDARTADGGPPFFGRYHPAPRHHSRFRKTGVGIV